MSFRPYTEIKSSGVEDERTNNTGITINKGVPVRINTSGELDFINVSVEAEAINVSGVASEPITNGSKGSVVNSGKISDIATTAALGDIVYVSKSGSLTNVKPSIGVSGFVAGDFVVMVGIIAKNESNPTLKDLMLNVDVVGQL